MPKSRIELGRGYNLGMLLIWSRNREVEGLGAVMRVNKTEKVVDKG